MSRDASPVGTSSRKPPSVPSATAPAEEYPVREYIGGMCMELAQMARCDGDERLAVLLETAAARSNEVRPGHLYTETTERVAPAQSAR